MYYFWNMPLKIISYAASMSVRTKLHVAHGHMCFSPNVSIPERNSHRKTIPSPEEITTYIACDAKIHFSLASKVTLFSDLKSSIPEQNALETNSSSSSFEVAFKN